MNMEDKSVAISMKWYLKVAGFSSVLIFTFIMIDHLNV